MPKIFKENAAFLILLGSYLLIDAMAVWDGAFAHRELGRLSCGALSLGRLAYIFIPGNLLSYAHQQCTSEVTNTGAAISFLTLKIAITEIAALAVYTFGLFSKFQSFIPRFEANTKKYGGLTNHFSMSFGILLGLATYCAYAYSNINKDPTHYRADLFFKLDEDFFCVLLLLVFLGATILPTLSVLTMLRRKTNSRKSD